MSARLRRCHAQRQASRPASFGPDSRPSLLAQSRTGTHRERLAQRISVLVDRAIAMTSLSTPCPASCGPAPGPLIVISPIGLAVHTTALVVPSMFASGSSRPTSSGCTRATSPRSAGVGELSVATCLIRPPVDGGPIELGASDVGDPLAGDLRRSKLPAEDEGGEDHHLCHRVVALDVCCRVTLGEAQSLCLCQRVLVGLAAGHPREDEVGGGVQQTAERGRDRARETSTRVLSTGVPDMTVDSARKATPRTRASSASSTPCRATGHLLDVTTGMPASAPRACG